MNGIEPITDSRILTSSSKVVPSFTGMEIVFVFTLECPTGFLVSEAVAAVIPTGILFFQRVKSVGSEINDRLLQPQIDHRH